jgi:dephospho-CoA kinase
MMILGLTGSIGMGKSETARMFRRAGVPVYDADAAVHAVMARGGAAVGPIEAAFPGVVRDGAVDRAALGARVFDDPPALRRLEAIVHPIVARRQKAFLKRASAARHPLVVLDIPLLLETGGETCCDAVAVVVAPPFVQAARVLKRPGMTAERLAAVRAQQMPDRHKCARADFIIPTGLGKAEALRHVREIIKQMAGRGDGLWPDRFVWMTRKKNARNRS